MNIRTKGPQQLKEEVLILTDRERETKSKEREGSNVRWGKNGGSTLIS